LPVTLVAIAMGGAVGAVLRYLVASGVQRGSGLDFPLGTLTVNVLGSLIMGLLFELLVERAALGPEWRAALLVGVLGAFTTFSTFSMETVNLIGEGRIVAATCNVALSVSTCLLAVWLGVSLGRQL
jgi:fluoride exporter